jgi:hypothetical protein
MAGFLLSSFVVAPVLGPEFRDFNTTNLLTAQPIMGFAVSNGYNFSSGVSGSVSNIDFAPASIYNFASSATTRAPITFTKA